MKTDLALLGAVVGDTIGSSYEFNSTKDYNFDIMKDNMTFTDDTVMSMAVTQWLLDDAHHTQDALALLMREWGARYPRAGYGGMFVRWLAYPDMGPYNSWGNGSAMRVSAVGMMFSTLEETLDMARRSAEVTHNHPEGIKGAQATAAAIFMARNGSTKQEIKDYITTTFGYDLSKTCDDIRDTYSFNESSQETVPQSIIAFLDSDDFEDAIRLTVSLGGDADTMGAITGAIALAYYKELPDELYHFVITRLPDEMKAILARF